jgi:hypothetical protein
MTKKPQTIRFSRWSSLFLLACLAMPALAMGCRSPQAATPVDDDPAPATPVSNSPDEVTCVLDSGVQSATASAPSTAPAGESEAVSSANQDTCAPANPAVNPSLLHCVWKRALERLGPQDPTRPPSPDTCRTAEVLERIGIQEAEAVLRRCPHPEQQNQDPVQPPKTRSSKVSVHVHRHSAYRADVVRVRLHMFGRTA